MKILSLLLYLSLRIYKKTTRISHNITWKNKIKKLIAAKGTKKLTNTEIEEIHLYFNGYDLQNISTQWHQFYSNCNGKFSAAYLPENIFYIEMEPRLNRVSYFPSLTDKNLLEKLFPTVQQPETVVKNINGCFYGNGQVIELETALSLCDIGKRLIIKPTLESGGGKNVSLFTSDNGITDAGQRLKQLFAEYGKDFIVQKVVPQHEVLKALNPSSLNTLRIMTYLEDGAVHILSTIVRIGRKGSYTDNGTTGGISCGIQNNGQFNDVGYQLSGDRFYETDSGIRFKDMKLSFMKKISSTVVKLHHEAPFFKLISWDLAIDESEQIVLIEYNVMGQGINSHQLNNGPVLAPLLKTLRT
ncbi:hypothetical protein FK220_019455 [Flavobacteriaceae bacterium TP-CH-4]|uniref:Alpha-L-glutamate ligase-related protein ATP-grasp domain-containing protein n=1 Tax=Pelagihabitans pacificus TaxID=2696054 RepID=A0A967AWM1_9FLAO|nr:sugar-transfer associated ATP-grasp domain-containing protein [Pelagihabitans pacificus]NHF61538.1 hypothetical protein [Pelagihabitans pacificus]